MKLQQNYNTVALFAVAAAGFSTSIIAAATGSHYGFALIAGFFSLTTSGFLAWYSIQ